MGVSLASHPGSQAFDVIGDALKSDAAGRKDAIKKGGAVFAFTLSNADGQQESWYIDLKRDGVVGKGTNPEGMKADGNVARQKPPLMINTDLLACCSHHPCLRYRFRQAGCRHCQRSEPLHVGQDQDSR